jgi:SPX domain protein involved in polyphosphate accumulation
MKNNFKISKTFRYERKFFLSEITTQELEGLVKFHPAIFSEIFNQRFINNIYFDTINLNNFNDNVEGTTDRVKVRIRWYGDLFGYIERPILEIKIKNGLLGKKMSMSIEPFEFNSKSNIANIVSNLDIRNDKLNIDFRTLYPSLVNRYKRKYFQSCDKKYRITIDSEQSFYKINNTNNFFLNIVNDNKSVIMELKYDEINDGGANLITSKFPFRVSKSSKYVNGLQQIYQII